MHPVFHLALEKHFSHRCYRLPLVPLTIGHLFLLRRLGSPLIDADEDAQIGDVLLAAFICSQPYWKSELDLKRPMRLRLFRWVWGKLCRGMDLASEAEAFIRYLADYQGGPRPERINRSNKATTPNEWRLYSALRADFHMTKEEALATSIAEATALCAANGERLGRVKLVDYSPERQSFVDRVFEYHRQKCEKLKQN